MPKTTIIIPLYNREAFIEDCIASLVRQRDHCDLEILVVNDGSTDNGPDIVERLNMKHGGIRQITTANQGVTKTRNVGLKHISGDTDYVSFLDSDDISPDGRFKTDLAYLENNRALQFTYGRMVLTNEFGKDLAPESDAELANVRGVSLSAGLFRKSFIERIGFLDESFEQSEDTDYLLRCFESTRDYQLVETVAVFYRRHEANMTRDRTKMAKYFILALHKSLARRKLDPTIKIPVGIFDIKEMKTGSFR